MRWTIEEVPWLELTASLLVAREVQAYTLPNLTRKTVSRTKKAARKCSTNEVISDLQRLIWVYRTKCGEKDSDPRGHLSHIKVALGGKWGQTRENIAGKPLKDLHIKVRCSCPAFLYWVSQWIAHKNDFLAGKPRGLLAPPQVRYRFKDGASTQRSLLCKHILRASVAFVRQPPLSL